MIKGTNITDTRLPDNDGADTARPASEAPINKLPASPMKTVAGWKLYRKKPSVAPVSAHATEAPSQAPCRARASPRKNDATAATPAATPSMLSSRLKALVIPTNENNVTSALTAYQGVSGKMAPKPTSSKPATTCRMNFSCGRNVTTSSTRPTKNIIAALTPTTAMCPTAVPPPTNGRFSKSATAPSAPTTVPAKIAIPPSNGTGRRFHRFADGCATAPRRFAKAPATGVSTTPKMSETPQATAKRRATLKLRPSLRRHGTLLLLQVHRPIHTADRARPRSVSSPAMGLSSACPRNSRRTLQSTE